MEETKDLYEMPDMEVLNLPNTSLLNLSNWGELDEIL